MKHSFVIMTPPIVIVLATMAIYAGADYGGDVPIFKPEAEIHDLMELNKQINNQLRTHLGAKPDWKEAVHEARLLAEIANVLQYHKSPEVADWWQFAGAFRDGARQIVKTAEAKDLKAARAATKGMFKSCKQCHDKYRD